MEIYPSAAPSSTCLRTSLPAASRTAVRHSVPTLLDVSAPTATTVLRLSVSPAIGCSSFPDTCNFGFQLLGAAAAVDANSAETVSCVPAPHVHRSLGAERQYCWADPLLTRCKFARGGDHAIPTARWSPVHPAARHRTRISAGSVPPLECARSHRPCCCQPEPQQPDTVATCAGRLDAACPTAELCPVLAVINANRHHELTTISTGRCHKPTTISASRRLYSTAVRATESTPRWVVLTHHLRLTLSLSAFVFAMRIASHHHHRRQRRPRGADHASACCCKLNCSSYGLW